MRALVSAISAITLVFAAAVANAALVSNGTLDGGALVTDTATGLQWLSPVATSGQSYNSVLAGFDGLTTTAGFTIATEAQVLGMFGPNFDPTNLVAYNAGVTTAAFAPINSFFNVYGVTEYVTCGGPCPRTQGFTSTTGGSAGTVIDIGYVTVGTQGEAITQSLAKTTSGDPQFGTFLVRESPITAAPEIDPASAAGGLTLLLGIMAVVRGDRRKPLSLPA